VAFQRNSFQAVMDVVGRAISDSLTALICHGTFDRHPNLRVASVENGASWLPGLMHKLGRAYGQMPQAFKEDPRDTFRTHVFVVPFFEDTPSKLTQLIPVERILFGSDWPHAEGLAEPLDYLTEWRDFKPDEVEKVFSSNLKGLLEGKRN
jgi:predicted TIM-barrel fold metal-dependent hydrolase